MNQLKLFAAVVREGSWLEARIDPAMPDRKPLPRSDLRMRNVPVGPWRCSARATSPWPSPWRAATPPRRSRRVARRGEGAPRASRHVGAVGRAVQSGGEGVRPARRRLLAALRLRQLHRRGLVADPRIKAVGFTGSRGGGTALMRIANNRPEPIPVYAEMSSINPVLVLPHAMASRGEAIAKAFIGSLTMGAGQFCTNPGLVLGAEGKDLDGFVGKVAENLPAAPAQTMLTPGIHQAYSGGVEKLAKNAGVKTVARGQAPASPNAGQAAFFSTTAKSFLTDHALRDEVFGSSSLLVRCPDVGAMREILESMEGQLTVTLQMDPEDMEYAKALLPVLERKAGRLLVNGFPTGVEVCHAMVHGGPFPSTADGRSTSVGSYAIYRFLRPVCYQDFPAALLPEALRDGNPQGLPSAWTGSVPPRGVARRREEPRRCCCPRRDGLEIQQPREARHVLHGFEIRIARAHWVLPGIITVSMGWITPLLASIWFQPSFAPLIVKPASLAAMVSVPPGSFASPGPAGPS
jgi:NADP-dependent aldehyde dehydrogenase